MNAFLADTFIGLLYASAYAIAASGLVLTYTTTRVFNLAHGAIGMLAAYMYWQFTHEEHMPALLAVVLIVAVLAPLLGLLIDRVAARNLGSSPVSVSLVVTIGLFVLMIGVAQQTWSATVGRSVQPFFGLRSVTIGTFRLGYSNILTMVVAIAVGAGLYVLLNRTRIGTAMRGAVDNRELLSLFGGAPERVSMLSWALGASLAALAGILLVASVGLNYYQLTFLVIDAFAAAIIGRLSSLPMTYLGALVVGLGQGYSAYLPQWKVLENFNQAIPTIVLFVVLIFLPQVRLRVGQIRGVVAAPVPTRLRTLESGVALVVIVALLGMWFNDTNVLRLGSGLVFAIVMLSLMLVTGYGGYVSMAQLSFMGLGAAVVAKLDTTSPLAIIVAVLICAAGGALVALPVLRLTGLYFALATFAFAQLMDSLVFQANFLFGFGGSLNAQRVDLFGISFGSNRSYDVLLAVLFALVAAGLLAMRRGALGRILIAMRDSQLACGTLGLNQRWYRVGILSLAAGIAGLGGAMDAGLRESGLSATDYQSLQGLVLLLLVVIFGVTSVSGALLGGMTMMLLPVIQSQFKSLAGLVFLLIGGGAVLLGRDPNGLCNYLFTGTRLALARVPLLSGLVTSGADRSAPLREAPEHSAEPQVVSHGVA